MSSHSEFPVPDWVQPEDRQRFAVALAALYHNPTGSIAELSKALGLSHAALGMALRGPGISARNCLALEALLGQERFPRQFFRPDLFSAEQA